MIFLQYNCLALLAQKPRHHCQPNGDMIAPCDAVIYRPSSNTLFPMEQQREVHINYISSNLCSPNSVSLTSPLCASLANHQLAHDIAQVKHRHPQVKQRHTRFNYFKHRYTNCIERWPVQKLVQLCVVLKKASGEGHKT